jgi:protein SCO1/2
MIAGVILADDHLKKSYILLLLSRLLADSCKLEGRPEHDARQMSRPKSIIRLSGVCRLLLAFLVAAANMEARGAVFTDPAPSPDFTLATTDGSRFHLQDHKGRVVLLYFGYTLCPDVCSRTMAILKSALNQMTPRERSAIDVVFVSLDPQRDSAKQLARFLGRFDAGFIGLVPDAEQLDRLKRDYNLMAKTLDGADKDHYSMIHTDLVFAIDRAGILRMAFLTGTKAATIAKDVRTLLETPAEQENNPP